jgi:hypothetical protein
MQTTVIAHFFNEEYLLPWWLEHHTRLFDHGILIDYASTDRSVEICRKLAPHWEVRQSQNKFFEATSADEEVMAIEKSVDGWKIALNITEFFVCRDMDLFKWSIQSFGGPMYAIRGIVMVDPPDYQYELLDKQRALISQRFHGFFEDEKLDATQTHLYRSRFFHRYSTGDYLPGRHLSRLPALMHPPGAFILWFAFSPWNEEVRLRKLQIQTKIPEADKQRGYGAQHLVNGEKLDLVYRGAAKKAEDLRARPEYLQILSGWDYEMLRREKGSALRPSLDVLAGMRSPITGWDFWNSLENSRLLEQKVSKAVWDYQYLQDGFRERQELYDLVMSSKSWKFIIFVRSVKDFFKRLIGKS